MPVFTDTIDEKHGNVEKQFYALIHEQHGKNMENVFAFKYTIYRPIYMYIVIFIYLFISCEE